MYIFLQFVYHGINSKMFKLSTIYIFLQLVVLIYVTQRQDFSQTLAAQMKIILKSTVMTGPNLQICVANPST